MELKLGLLYIILNLVNSQPLSNLGYQYIELTLTSFSFIILYQGYSNALFFLVLYQHFLQLPLTMHLLSSTNVHYPTFSPKIRSSSVLYLILNPHTHTQPQLASAIPTEHQTLLVNSPFLLPMRMCFSLQLWLKWRFFAERMCQEIHCFPKCGLQTFRITKGRPKNHHLWCLKFET